MSSLEYPMTTVQRVIRQFPKISKKKQSKFCLSLLRLKEGEHKHLIRATSEQDLLADISLNRFIITKHFDLKKPIQLASTAGIKNSQSKSIKELIRVNSNNMRTLIYWKSFKKSIILKKSRELDLKNQRIHINSQSKQWCLFPDKKTIIPKYIPDSKCNMKSNHKPPVIIDDRYDCSLKEKKMEKQMSSPKVRLSQDSMHELFPNNFKINIHVK